MLGRIYITPKAGKFRNKILLLDHVEAMPHVRSAKVSQHPVEGKNVGVADHRYREPVMITITGMVSDNWQSTLLTVPEPPIKLDPTTKLEVLREKSLVEFPAGTLVNRVMNDLYAGLYADSVEYREAVMQGGRYWLDATVQLMAEEEDLLNTGESFQLPMGGDSNNRATDGGEINTISQAIDLLEYIDKESIVCDISSKFREYPDMVLTNYTNALRNGTSRGAYWVTLIFQERQAAKVTLITNSIDVISTEKTSDPTNKGKKVPLTVDSRNILRKSVVIVWNEELSKFAENNPEINAFVLVVDSAGITAKEKTITVALNRLVSSVGNGKDPVAKGRALKGTTRHIRSALGVIFKRKGKI